MPIPLYIDGYIQQIGGVDSRSVEELLWHSTCLVLHMVANTLLGIRYDSHQRLFNLPGHVQDPPHDAQGVQTAGCLRAYSSEDQKQNPLQAV